MLTILIFYGPFLLGENPTPKSRGSGSEIRRSRELLPNRIRDHPHPERGEVRNPELTVSVGLHVAVVFVVGVVALVGFVTG